MATYTLEDENGRRITVEGDSPPTEAEAEQLFAAAPKQGRPTNAERAKANLTSGFVGSSPGLEARKLSTGGVLKLTSALQGSPFGPAQLLAGAMAEIGRAAGAPSNDEEYKKFMADYNAMPGAQGALERTVAIGSNIAGGFLAPENFGGPIGKGGVAVRALKAAALAGGTNAVLDAGTQAADVATGVQNEFSFTRLLENAGAGFVLGGLLQATPEVVGKAKGWVKNILGKSDVPPVLRAEAEAVAKAVPDVEIKATAPDAKEGELLGDYAQRKIKEIRNTKPAGSEPIDINTDAFRDLTTSTLDQLENVAKTGTVQPKEIRPGFTMPEALPEDAIVNPNIVIETNKRLVETGTLLKELRREAELKADGATADALGAAEKMFGDALKQWQTARKTAGLSLRQYQMGLDGIRRIANLIPEMRDVKKKLPIINSLIDNVKNGRGMAAGKDLVNYARQNMFGFMSVNLDLFGNAIAVAGKTPGWIVADAYDLATKGSADRLAGVWRAIKNPRKAFSIPEQLKRELGTTFSGEQSNVMVDIPNHPVATKLAEWSMALPVKLKGAADTYFGTTFAAADLYSSALREARSRNLRGVDKEKFIEAFIHNPSDAAAESAIQLGSRMKFNRRLSKLEENISKSLGVKLFFDAYPRWSFQFSRWAAETLGADTHFFSKIKDGKATGADVAEYLTTTATGWGGVYLANQFYDNIDFKTMEYVKEDGNRVRLANLAPLPDALALSALLRGDTDKAKSAFQYSSMFGSQALSTRGILSDILRTTEQSFKGDFTAVNLGRELENQANALVPGQAMLAAVESLVNPSMQEGLGANIPGVSSLLPTRSNVTTGEPMEIRQKVLGVELPAIRGVAFPGAVKIVNPVERALLEHGLATYRPRRSPLLSLAAPDVPNNLRLEYEQYLGQYTKQFITPVIESKTFYNAPFEIRAQILNNMRNAANIRAKVELQKRHKDFMPAPEKPSMNVRLLPERIYNEDEQQ